MCQHGVSGTLQAFGNEDEPLSCNLQVNVEMTLNSSTAAASSPRALQNHDEVNFVHTKSLAHGMSMNSTQLILPVRSSTKYAVSAHVAAVDGAGSCNDGYEDAPSGGYANATGEAGAHRCAEAAREATPC